MKSVKIAKFLVLSTALALASCGGDTTDTGTANTGTTNTNNIENKKIVLTMSDGRTGSQVFNDADITLSITESDAKIYYTMDGTEPTSGSTLYTAPFKLDKPSATIKAVGLKAGKSSPIFERKIYKVTTECNTKECILTEIFTTNKGKTDYNYIGLASSLTDLSELFADKTTFNADISGWDVSQVTDMSWMFNGASAFNQELNNWDVGKVTDMSYMFSGAEAFNQDLNDWDVSQVTDMSLMFKGAKAFNQELNNWDVSQVTNMVGMFKGAKAFNQELNNWDVGKVTNMIEMFKGAEAFNQELNNWNVGQITHMTEMFKGAKAFNQNLTVWNDRLPDKVWHDDIFVGSAMIPEYIPAKLK